MYVLILNKFSTTLCLQFVEKFLNNCFMVKTVSLKDPSWTLLLKEISDKFVTVAYTIQLNFTLTLACIKLLIVFSMNKFVNS